MIRITGVSAPLSYDEAWLRKSAAKKLHISEKDIQGLEVFRRSVDARKKDRVHFTMTVDVVMDKEKTVVSRLRDPNVQSVLPYRYQLPAGAVLPQRPVVIGLGPGGLFAGLILAQAGLRPLVIERGEPVDRRTRSVRQFWEQGRLDPDSNVQFGEGGAGTFSDGKLNTGTKDPRARKVLQELVAAGAPGEILWQAKPHVGTDRLPQAVRNIRQTICEWGGEVRFETQCVGLLHKEGQLTGVRIRCHGQEEEISTRHVVLAVGHSARDTFSMLQEMKIPMEPKAFSIGARIEHRQAWLDRAQYGAAAGHPALGAADYHLAVHLPNGRGVYSFCMCPGGTVVAAASEENTVVTNGMSCFARDGENCNAALLVGVEPADFGVPGPLGGVEFQRKWEKAAYALSGSYAAPVQRVEDFLQGRKSTRWGEVTPTYRPGAVPENLNRCLPEFVTESMRQGIRLLDGKLHGFAMGDALLTGVETRSSSPVRILRDDSLQCPTLRGLYPCGEGAGYAGGIVSAAVDGIRCAEQILLDSARKK